MPGGRRTKDGFMVRVPYVHLIAWGALGGLLSGITGVSGGVCFVPALVIAGIPVHAAVATHTVSGQISPDYVVRYGVGAAAGAFIGALIAPRVKGNNIRQIFGMVLILVALIMIYQKVLMV